MKKLIGLILLLNGMSCVDAIIPERCMMLVALNAQKKNYKSASQRVIELLCSNLLRYKDVVTTCWGYGFDCTKFVSETLCNCSLTYDHR